MLAQTYCAREVMFCFSGLENYLVLNDVDAISMLFALVICTVDLYIMNFVAYLREKQIHLPNFKCATTYRKIAVIESIFDMYIFQCE